MSILYKVIVVLACVSVVWAVQNNKNIIPLEQQQAIEKAILKVHAEMKKAAENLDAEALFEHVLDTGKDPIIEDGVLFRTHKEALDANKQGFQGLQSYNTTFNYEQVTVLSPTIALSTALGTYSVTTTDGQTFEGPFATTIVFILREGQWKALHAHRSLPNPR